MSPRLGGRRMARLERNQVNRYCHQRTMSSDMSCGHLELSIPGFLWYEPTYFCSPPGPASSFFVCVFIHVHVHAHVPACVCEYVVCVCVSHNSMVSVFLGHSILFLEAALQVGTHGVVYAGWPVRPPDPPVCLLALGQGLLDNTTTLALMWVLRFVCRPSHLEAGPLPSEPSSGPPLSALLVLPLIEQLVGSLLLESE